MNIDDEPFHHATLRICARQCRAVFTRTDPHCAKAIILRRDFAGTSKYPPNDSVQNTVNQEQKQRDQPGKNKYRNGRANDRIAGRPGYFEPFLTHRFYVVD
jgi:hypothetical protein